MNGKYDIVRGDPRLHREPAIAIVLRNLDAAPEVTYARFPKYYEQNPHGPTLFCFVRDTSSGEFVGMASLFPILLSIAGSPVLGAIPGDSVVDRPHRALGPALAVHRALIDAMPANGLRFAYGLPNQYSDPVTARMGFVDVGQPARFVKILNARTLEARLAGRPAGRVVSAVGRVAIDPVLFVASRERLYRRGANVRVAHAERFDERFDEVFQAMSRQHPITAHRTSALMNWKYEKDGTEGVLGDHSILTITDDGTNVAAYAVYKTIDGVRYVEDVGFMPTRATVDMLLSELVLDARRAKDDAISVTHLEAGSLFESRLRRFGFVRRAERARLRVYVPEGSALPVDLLDRGNWFFLGGDSDV
jgi:hypothetical protein